MTSSAREKEEALVSSRNISFFYADASLHSLNVDFALNFSSNKALARSRRTRTEMNLTWTSRESHSELPFPTVDRKPNNSHQSFTDCDSVSSNTPDFGTGTSSVLVALEMLFYNWIHYPQAVLDPNALFTPPQIRAVCFATRPAISNDSGKIIRRAIQTSQQDTSSISNNEYDFRGPSYILKRSEKVT